MRFLTTAAREIVITLATVGVGVFVTGIVDAKMRELLDPPDDDVVILCPTCGTRNRVDDGDLFLCWKCEIDRRTAKPASEPAPADPAGE